MSTVSNCFPARNFRHQALTASDIREKIDVIFDKMVLLFFSYHLSSCSPAYLHLQRPPPLIMQQTDKSISPARHPHVSPCNADLPHILMGHQSQAILVDDFPSPERVNPVPEQMDMSSELANQAAALVAASQPPRASFSSFPYPPHRQAPDSPLTNSEQLAILRDAYARNPNPGKRELEALAERTGRPWNKIREYFRQRRNKLRGLVDLEHMEEPGRATGWYGSLSPNQLL